MISNSQIGTSLIEQAVNYLKEGQLVAFPTETVYGLGACAKNKKALHRLYQAKGRPSSHPVIVHIADLENITDWANSISTAAQILAETFWPGPLTLILPKAKNVLPEITGGQNSIGIRIPKHPIALDLLKAYGSGIAAPSANKFGKLSTTSAEDVSNEFKDEIAMVLDGGLCTVGIESTIVDCTTENIKVLRPGIISQDEIMELLAQHGIFSEGIFPAKTNLRTPGNLPSHYAPMTPLAVLTSTKLLQQIESEKSAGKKVAVLAMAPIENENIKIIVAPNDPYEYAKYLYSNLRELDKLKADIILVEQVPETNIWAGIRDRLMRASY